MALDDAGSAVRTGLRALVTGAVAMYFFDPEAGRRRRALVRDQLVRWARKGRDEVETNVRDVANRARGVAAVARRATTGVVEPLTDRIVAERVRARLGALDHPGAVTVEVHDGHVVMRGTVVASDAERARDVVAEVRGVREVVDELTVRGGSAAAPARSGRRRRRGPTPMPPATRLGLVVLGTAALAPIVRRLDPLPTVRVIGMGLLAAAVVTAERVRLRAVAGSRDVARVPLERAS